ncbi:MAG: hypothetical protein JXR48_14575 [Candidatus Delongbacteria bacterium]|nr:hypothetical protein [Candidatus Delongbacteria bacterium]MBN2836181.1 hypothetical protein [Candidatus Delongbacteria bacterium]
MYQERNNYYHKRNFNRKVSEAGSIWGTCQIECDADENAFLMDVGFG